MNYITSKLNVEIVARSLSTNRFNHLARTDIDFPNQMTATT